MNPGVEERTVPADDVPFVPDRMAGHLHLRGDLSPATAATLITWVADCPHCGADLEGDAGKGLAEDRDVVFAARTRDQDAHRLTRPLLCDTCEGLVEAFVEEAAQPRHVTSRNPRYVKSGAYWVPMRNKEGYMQVVPDVRVWKATGEGAKRYRERYGLAGGEG